MSSTSRPPPRRGGVAKTNLPCARPGTDDRHSRYRMTGRTASGSSASLNRFSPDVRGANHAPPRLSRSQRRRGCRTPRGRAVLAFPALPAHATTFRGSLRRRLPLTPQGMGGVVAYRHRYGYPRAAPGSQGTRPNTHGRTRARESRPGDGLHRRRGMGHVAGARQSPP